MKDILLLRFDAPLMSFGGIAIDAHGVVDAFPGVSMICGVLANALGYDHRDFAETQRLQDRLHVACRLDRRGVREVDYHTVDLGTPSMVRPGWTTSGVVEERRGGPASSGTHIRFRHYAADSVATVALWLDAADGPALAELADALDRPARPLFLGRKACIPSGRLVLGITKSETLYDALRSAPLHPGSDRTPTYSASWPVGDGPEHGTLLSANDLRDWTMNVHAGARWVRVGVVSPEVAHG